MEIDLDEAHPRKKGELIFIGTARQYRADCQAGQFKIGSSKMTGRSLIMQVIAARLIEDELFGYDWQKWLNVIFVDKEGVVSSILFKTESMDNFLELYRQGVADGIKLTAKAVTATMSKRTSRANSESYFAVEFEIAGDGLYTEAITEFKSSCNLGALYRINASPALTNGSVTTPALSSPK